MVGKHFKYTRESRSWYSTLSMLLRDFKAFEIYSLSHIKEIKELL